MLSQAWLQRLDGIRHFILHIKAIGMFWRENSDTKPCWPFKYALLNWTVWCCMHSAGSECLFLHLSCRVIERHGKKPRCAIPFIHKKFWGLLCVVGSYCVAFCFWSFCFSYPANLSLVQDLTKDIKTGIYDPSNSDDPFTGFETSVTVALKSLVKVIV